MPPYGSIAPLVTAIVRNEGVLHTADARAYERQREDERGLHRKDCPGGAFRFRYIHLGNG